jgi:endoribonuclease Dicer
MHSAYICEVILPEKSPIRGLVGKPASQKYLAKQSAAFDTCLLLRKSNLLDDYFMSAYHKRLPVMRNAKLAIVSKKTNQYDMITKPAFWAKGCGVPPESLYGTIITLEPVRKLAREHRCLVLLTRERLPEFPQFPIYLEDDVETEVRSVPLKASMAVKAEDLNILTTFTLRVFRDLFHKTYERDPEVMSYWLVPAATDIGDFGPDLVLRDIIDWDTLASVQENDEIARTDPKVAENIQDLFVYDKWDGRYRYFTIAADKSLRPSDPPPSFVPGRRHMNNIMNYSLSLFKNSRAKFLTQCDWDQPVFQAELISLRRDLLDKMTEQEKAFEKVCVICLEGLGISAVSLFFKCQPLFPVRVI